MWLEKQLIIQGWDLITLNQQFPLFPRAGAPPLVVIGLGLTLGIGLCLR